MPWVPVPLWWSGVLYSTGARVGAGFCNKRYNAVRQKWYCGVKLHVFVILRPGQLPLLRVAQISPASCPDLLAAKQIDRDCAPVSSGHLFADLAYCDADWAAFLKNVEILRSLRQGRKSVMTFCVPAIVLISPSVLHVSSSNCSFIGPISSLLSRMPLVCDPSLASFSTFSSLPLFSPLRLVSTINLHL